MANIYTRYQLAEIQEAFDFFGEEGDNKISIDQIGICLRVLGEEPTEADIKRLTQHQKPDERISFDVFMSIYDAITKARSGSSSGSCCGGSDSAKGKADVLIENLRYLDENGSGCMTGAELRSLLIILGEKFTEVDQLLAAQTAGLHEYVNYEDFVRKNMTE